MKAERWIMATVSIMAFVLVWASHSLSQAEAPAVTDECQWMYDKAYGAALQMDKDKGIRNYDGAYGSGEWNHYASDVSIMWSQLYMACKAKVRR